jgi:hypothetical protein
MSLQSLRAANKKRIDDLCEEHKGSLHRIDKKQVNIKAAEGADATGELGGTFTPSASELKKINEFTRREVGADDVAAFKTMSCNDMFDRDDERFTTDTVDGFAALKPPYSFTGKSFMADHDYQMAKVRGRIFDTGTEKVEGTNFLTNKVYVPKTAQYADYLENVDFGLAWAVSVGVVIDKANCTICEAPVYNSRFFGSWCQSGHDKGYFYVPGEEEDDGWGGFLPVDPDTKGAVKAQVNLSDPIDGYELSQVFLGAQYMAELSKKPGFKGVVKAASARTIPILGLSAKEAEEIPVPQEDQEVAEAREKYEVTIDADGDPTWTDDQGLVWVYTTNDNDTSEVMCLGRSDDEDGENAEGVSEGSSVSGQELRADGEEVEGGEDGPGQEAGRGSQAADTEEGSADGEPSGSVEAEGEKAVNKQQVLEALKHFGIHIGEVEDAEGDGLKELVASYNDLFSKVTDLTPKAELGEKYIVQLRADAMAWYVKARQSGEGHPVSTESFSKLLDRVQDDPEVLQDIIDEQKQLARAKFPEAVRRSTFETDPNVPDGAEPVAVDSTSEQKGNKFAQRIHR